MTSNTSSKQCSGRHRLNKGLFFAIEGIDGAGKTTQAQLLKKRLQDAGIETVYVKEPTDGPWGRKIRRIAMEGRDHVAPETELEYFIRDREEDVRENIAPALDRNKIVIADRYYYSTIAYQSVLGLDSETIRQKNQPFPVPDLVLIIDVEVPLGQIRITRHRGQETNPGYEQAAFLESVKRVFDEMDDPNIVRIDGRPAEEIVEEDIWRIVRPMVEKHISSTSDGLDANSRPNRGMME